MKWNLTVCVFVCVGFETGSNSAAQSALTLHLLLPQPPGVTSMCTLSALSVILPFASLMTDDEHQFLYLLTIWMLCRMFFAHLEIGWPLSYRFSAFIMDAYY